MAKQLRSNKRPLFWLTLLLTFLAASPLLAAPARERDLPREKDQWIELSTVHFTLYSGLSRSGTQKIAWHLEQLRAVLGWLTPWDLDASVPTNIYVFNNDRAFAPYKNLFRGKTIEGDGYFLGRSDGGFVAINGGAAGQPENLIFHEYVHNIVHHNARTMPLWLNEGLAELFSTLEVSGRRVEVGRPIADHLALLRSSQLIPLTDLFPIGSDSDEYNEGSRRGIFYAQSWALVHTLLIGDSERRGRLLRSLRRVMVGEEVGGVFHDLLTADQGGIERELRGHVQSGRWPVAKTEVREFDASSFQVRVMDHLEVLRRLGHLLVNLKRFNAAAKHFEAALERQPGDALALAGLADLARHQERYDEALALYARVFQAVDSPVADSPGAEGLSMILYRYAECLLSRDADDEAAQLEAAEVLRLSMALRANFAPARVLLSKVQGAISNAELKRVRSSEGGGWTKKYNEAVSLAKSGDRESAKRLLEDLAALSVGSQAEAVQTLLAKIHGESQLDAVMERMNGLLGQRRLAEAIELLRQVDAEPDSPEGLWIAEQITRIRRKIERNRFNERFNEALDHLQAGDASSACGILERLLATLSEESPEAQRARVLLTKARAKLK